MRPSNRFAVAALAVALVSTPFARAATLAPVQVLSDDVIDNFTGEDDTPIGSASDLVAGYIGEDDTAMQFVLQVADLPDQLSTGVPVEVLYYWDFSINDPATSRTAGFELEFDSGPEVDAPDPVGQINGAHLSNNCHTTGNLVQCDPTGAHVTLTFDTAANTITASVLRSDLKDANGNSVAVDGGILSQEKYFSGPAACVTFGVLIYEGACDEAVMDDVYILGTPR